MVLSVALKLVYGFGGFCPCMEDDGYNDQYEWGEDWGEGCEEEEEYI